MKIIDLSKKIKNNMEVYPGDPAVKVSNSHIIEIDGFRLKTLTMGTHTGTHVDAFSHMIHNGKSLDEIPLGKFLGKAVYISKTDDFPKGKGLIFDSRVDIESREKIIKANPNFVAGDLSYELEVELLEREIITYTDLINLEKLPRNTEFFFIGLPLKIEDGDGSPVRAIAIID